MTSQPSETRTVRNMYGVLRTVRSYNYRKISYVNESSQVKSMMLTDAGSDKPLYPYHS